MSTSTTLEELYRDLSLAPPLKMPEGLGHFAVFDRVALEKKNLGTMPYNKRRYYKISWIKGHNQAVYADRTFELNGDSLLFANPHIPYHWVSKGGAQAGHFCVFTEDYWTTHKRGLLLEQLPLFQVGQCPIFSLTAEQTAVVAGIFEKMHAEVDSDYAYKHDLLSGYLVELIHFGQKLTPAPLAAATMEAPERITSLFFELLERQFQAVSPTHQLMAKAPKDYAERLAIHVNYLNRMLKERTSQTTSQWIAARMVAEAKIMLRRHWWSVSEIAYALGFREVSHFSNFFKKHTQLPPSAFRTA